MFKVILIGDNDALKGLGEREKEEREKYIWCNFGSIHY
jgi:hypothetical protein